MTDSHLSEKHPEEKHLHALLEELRDVVLAERRAAKALRVDDMMEQTDQKERILQELLPLLNARGDLDAETKALAGAIYTENLRNAWFFWSALKWVRESLDFMGQAVYPVAYAENGAFSKPRRSGALISGKI